MSAPDPQYVAIRQSIEDALAADPSADVTTLVEQLHARYGEIVRGGNTTDGYPYPSPTDPLMEGADAIRSLAEALAARTVTRTYTPANAAALMAGYPLGLSMFTLSSTSHTSMGFPGSGGCTVLTIKNSTNQASQYVFPAGGSGGGLPYYRSGGVTAWGPWRFAVPAQASGAISGITGGADATRTRTVTLPAGKFTAYPQVILGLATSNGSASTVNTECWVGTTTTSSFNIGVNRSNASDVSVRWQAIQDDTTVSALSALAAPLEADEFATVVCPTPGCPNEGIPIEVDTTWTEEDGTTHPTDEIVCGLCGAVLTPTAIEEEGTP